MVRKSSIPAYQISHKKKSIRAHGVWKNRWSIQAPFWSPYWPTLTAGCPAPPLPLCLPLSTVPLAYTPPPYLEHQTSSLDSWCADPHLPAALSGEEELGVNQWRQASLRLLGGLGLGSARRDCSGAFLGSAADYLHTFEPYFPVLQQLVSTWTDSEAPVWSARSLHACMVHLTTILEERQARAPLPQPVVNQDSPASASNLREAKNSYIIEYLLLRLTWRGTNSCPTYRSENRPRCYHSQNGVLVPSYSPCHPCQSSFCPLRRCSLACFDGCTCQSSRTFHVVPVSARRGSTAITCPGWHLLTWLNACLPDGMTTCGVL